MAVLALSATNRAFADLARTTSTLYVPYGRYVILGCILGASGWNVYTARWNAYQLGGIGCALFLVLTPGFGVQYLIYVCPLLFAVSLGWAIGYATLAGRVRWPGVLQAFGTTPCPCGRGLTPTFRCPSRWSVCWCGYC